MTRSRSELVDREDGGFYHLGGRCVRRAMLCGRDLSHRRGWIEKLMLEFAEVFTVHVTEYAVMQRASKDAACRLVCPCFTHARGWISR